MDREGESRGISDLLAGCHLISLPRLRLQQITLLSLITPPGRQQRIWHMNTCISTQWRAQITKVIHTASAVMPGLAAWCAKQHNEYYYFSPFPHV